MVKRRRPVKTYTDEVVSKEFLGIGRSITEDQFEDIQRRTETALTEVRRMFRDTPWQKRDMVSGGEMVEEPIQKEGGEGHED